MKSHGTNHSLFPLPGLACAVLLGNFRAFMARMLMLAMLLLWSAVARAGDWQVYSIGGRDYLSMENVAEFYGLPKIEKTEREFRASSGVRSLRTSLNSAEFFINNLKFILSYPTVEYNGKICISRMDLVKLIEPVMRPSRIKNAPVIDTVVLDPGHGGHDNGAMSMWGPEKAYALDVAHRARALLQAAGFRVVMTRSDDTFIPLHDRARMASQYPRAIFISIHFNSGGWGTGVETFTLAPRGVPSMMSDGPSVSDLVQCPGNARDAENIALATAAHAALVVKTRMFDRGLKRARFVVIREVTIPGVLLECGFQSNPYDGKMIATPLYRQTLAQAILAAVTNYRKAVGAPEVKVPVQPSATPKSASTEAPTVHIPTDRKPGTDSASAAKPAEESATESTPPKETKESKPAPAAKEESKEKTTSKKSSSSSKKKSSKPAPIDPPKTK